jgi:xylulose-5-phosphate/fructose-6-phosphate phosphoketolase
MPAQIISQPNPPPEPSLLPDSVLNYDVAIDTKDYLSPAELVSIQLFRRAADYIAAGRYAFFILFYHSNLLFQL